MKTSSDLEASRTLLKRLEDDRIKLWCEANDIVCQSKKKLSEKEITELRQHKPAILNLLAARKQSAQEEEPRGANTNSPEERKKRRRVVMDPEAREGEELQEHYDRLMERAQKCIRQGLTDLDKRARTRRLEKRTPTLASSA